MTDIEIFDVDDKDEFKDEVDGTVNGKSAYYVDEADALPSKLQYTHFDMLYTLTSITTYIFDLVMDCIVATYFYHIGTSHEHQEEHAWYFGLTISFILLPSITMTGFSLRWYLMDSENEQLPRVPMWKWIIRVIVLLFQVSPILRYVDSIRNGLESRRAARRGDKVDQIKYFTLMIYEDADATLLRLFECFMESAPQLVLQIYILIDDPHATQTSNLHIVEDGDINYRLKTSILAISVLSSLVSLAWSLAVYHRSLRYTFPNKKNISWRGTALQFLWHFSSITARVLALSLFASMSPHYVSIIICVHWALMLIWILIQKTEACNTKCEEFLFNIVLAAVYIFSFFNAKEGPTRYKYLIFYIVCFAENTIMIVTWFMLADPNHWYYYPAIIGHYLAFFLGIFFMLLYYYYLHPSLINSFFKQKLSPRRQKKTASERKQTLYIDLHGKESNKASNRNSSRMATVSQRAESPLSLSASSPDLEADDQKYFHRPVRRSVSEPRYRHDRFLDLSRARRLTSLGNRDIM